MRRYAIGNLVLVSAALACAACSTGTDPVVPGPGGEAGGAGIGASGGTAGASVGGSGGTTGATGGSGAAGSSGKGGSLGTGAGGGAGAGTSGGGTGGSSGAGSMGGATAGTSAAGGSAGVAGAGGAGGTGATSGAGGAAGSGTAGSAVGGTNAGGSAGAGGQCAKPGTLHPPDPAMPGIYCPLGGPTGMGTHCVVGKEHCCEGVVGEVTMCVPIGSPCPQAKVTDWACEDPTDCQPAGMQCCGNGSVVINVDPMCTNFASKMTGTACKAKCDPADTTMCASDAECPVGKMCIPFRKAGNQVGGCQK